MCIGIFKPKDALLTKAVLKTCFKNNSDGCGFAYPDDKGKQVLVKRGYFGFRKFWRDFRELQKDRAMLIHFRIATSGQVDEENCHPWQIDKKHALIHNGNLEHKLDEKSDEKSDTGLFVQKILQPLFTNPALKNKRFWALEAFKWLMEETIGFRNKMVILDASGLAAIYNEIAGEWDNKVWFSNKTYKEERKTNKGAEVRIENRGSCRVEVTKLVNGREYCKYLSPLPPSSSSSLCLMPPPMTPELQNILNESKIDMASLY